MHLRGAEGLTVLCLIECPTIIQRKMCGKATSHNRSHDRGVTHLKPEGLRNVRTKGERIFEQVLARTGRADRNPSWGQNAQRGHRGR